MHFSKRAQELDPVSNVSPTRQNSIAALSGLLKLTAATGAGAFGLSALKQLYRRLSEPDLSGGPIDPRLQDNLMEYPVKPGLLKKKKQQDADNIIRKSAADNKSWSDRLSEIIYDAVQGKSTADLSQPVKNFYNAARETPWIFPVAGVTLPTAAILGWKGARNIGDYLKKRDQTTELEDAKREYEDAMLGQYKKRQKVAEQREKSAFIDLSTPAGLYTAYASGTSSLAAILGYMKYRESYKKRLTEVLKQRAAQRAKDVPPEIHLVPEPYETDSK